MRYPIYRPRRVREQEHLRRMVRETHLAVDHLIYPLFVVPGAGVQQEIRSMPGTFHLSIDRLLEEVKEVQDLGIPGIILFGLPEHKDALGSSGYAEDGIIPQAVSALKKAVPEMTVITDVCLCEYTSHGHCGVIEGEHVVNDASLELLAKAALAYVRAGADMVAPSDMMDGRVQAIRQELDRAGYSQIPIMSYAAKYASSFYGPFREAADSAPQFGDRRSYQMDPANSREAMREIRLDIDEGADIIMVKPALPYLDIIYRVKQSFDLPVAAYNVSGEYAMIKAAALQGWIDGDRVMLEALLSIRRAGADMILTYFAKEAARLLASGWV
jgi:porphobilinogen synthase